MSFNSNISTVKREYVAEKQKKRFEYVDRQDAKSGDDAMSKFEWATTWGKSCGGWMVFDSEGTLDDWLRNG